MNCFININIATHKDVVLMKGKIPNTDWNSIQTKVDQVLGEEFWQDIAEMIPILGPRIDVYETKREVVVLVELPNLESTEDIHITMNGSVMTVSGHIVSYYPVDHHPLITERFFGKFTRKITLPNLVYHDIRAKYQNGLLTVTLPKTNIVQEKQIEIEHE